MKEYQFKLDFTVRDYECDLAAMVNNASYMNYIEHARHEFLRSKGIDFAKLAHEGIYLVVIRIEIDFLFPLRSGDRFYVGTNAGRISRLRVGLYQDIYRYPDGKPIVKAIVVTSAINDNGRPIMPKELERILPG